MKYLYSSISDDSFDSSSEGKLSISNIDRAFKALKANDKRQDEDREKRRLKDLSKMGPFMKRVYDEMNRCVKNGVSIADLEMFYQTVLGLVEGLFLIVPHPIYTETVSMLREWEVPEEVIANIYESKLIDIK